MEGSTNATSKLWPLDLGIIQNFKVHYRKLFLQYILDKIDDYSTATDVKSVNVLVAIRWLQRLGFQLETISKCFRMAGILDSSLDVISCDLDEDPFSGADEGDGTSGAQLTVVQ